MSLIQSLTQQLQPLSPQQAKALSFLQEKGFPSKKDENWKYTSLKAWVEKDYALAHSQGLEPQIALSSTYKAVFVNGCFKMDLSNLPASVKFQQKEVEAEVTDSFDALNASLSPAWSVLKIDDKARLDHPLEVLFISLAKEPQSISSSRVEIQVGRDSSLAILERHIQQDQCESFVDVQIHMTVASGSKVEYVQIQDQNTKSFHYAKTKLELIENTNVTTLVVALGSKQSRSEFEVNINSEGAEARVLGVYALTDAQQSDHYTAIRHHKGGSHTEQVYKGLLDGKSKAVFNGHVYIAQDAQKANSEQLNMNLLLSPNAEINSKPELKIYADDVKASHGSTIGQLQKEELFYLRSRGIKKSIAVQMLAQAFVMDLVERLENEELKKIVGTQLTEKLTTFEGIQEL